MFILYQKVVGLIFTSSLNASLCQADHADCHISGEANLVSYHQRDVANMLLKCYRDKKLGSQYFQNHGQNLDWLRHSSQETALSFRY